jgi:vacuolar-type H+-ATPase subunit I/STV1
LVAISNSVPSSPLADYFVAYLAMDTQGVPQPTAEITTRSTKDISCSNSVDIEGDVALLESEIDKLRVSLPNIRRWKRRLDELGRIRALVTARLLKVDQLISDLEDKISELKEEAANLDMEFDWGRPLDPQDLERRRLAMLEVSLKEEIEIRRLLQNKMDRVKIESQQIEEGLAIHERTWKDPASDIKHLTIRTRVLVDKLRHLQRQERIRNLMLPSHN